MPSDHLWWLSWLKATRRQLASPEDAVGSTEKKAESLGEEEGDRQGRQTE